VAAGETRGLKDFVTRSSTRRAEARSFSGSITSTRCAIAGGPGREKHLPAVLPGARSFVSARLIDYLFPLDLVMKGAQLPHFAILEGNHRRSSAT
jgi:hypothetical protein